MMDKKPEQISKLQQELNRTQAELSILYEVSNAMRTTLRLDEILYIILTGVTAHSGLRFNRAMLFLVNENDKIIEGKMGIGPVTGEKAKKIWDKIEKEQTDLNNLIEAYKASGKMIDSEFNRFVRQFKLPLDPKQNNLLSLCYFDMMPLHITKKSIGKYRKDPLLDKFNTTEVVLIPLRAKDKVVGIIVADNIFTQKPITKDNLRIFTMLANQAGLAIENSQLYEHAVMRTNTDSLTELWNHGYFQLNLQEELSRTKALKLPLSLIMIDIDNFKSYNDTLGHQVGDKILKELSTIFKEHSRKMDYVCRYGGEEFAIILPQTPRKEALFIANRLREITENHNFSFGETKSEPKITISLGVATYPEDAKNKSNLVNAADEALFKAKKDGKNLVRSAI